MRALLFKNPDASNVAFTQDHLLFLRGTTLMAQPFDAGRLALTDEPVPVADQVQILGSPPIGVFSASENGLLVYHTGTAAGFSQLGWFDRSGKQLARLGDPGTYADVHLSADAKRVAISLADSSATIRDLWLFDVGRGLRTRFTFDPAQNIAPVWSPDGSRVVFSSNRKGVSDLYLKAASGAGNDELLLSDALNKTPAGWSPDGRFILYNRGRGLTGPPDSDLWILPLLGDRKPYPFLQTRFNEVGGFFSSDGRWIAYVSNESGRNEVYVTPFPGPGGKWQISTTGGNFLRWRRDGKEIFYLALDNRLMAAAVNGQGAAFEVGDVRPLFTMQVAGPRFPYDVSPDGQRFLVNTVANQTSVPTSMTVVVNWMASLRK